MQHGLTDEVLRQLSGTACCVCAGVCFFTIGSVARARHQQLLLETMAIYASGKF